MSDAIAENATPIRCIAEDDGAEILVYWSTPRAKDIEAGRWMPNRYMLQDGSEVEPFDGASYRIKSSGRVLRSPANSGCILLDLPARRTAQPSTPPARTADIANFDGP